MGVTIHRNLETWRDFLIQQVITDVKIDFFLLKGSQYQSQQQPVLVSASAGDPSADWDLIDVDEEDEDEGGDNKAFVETAENRLIGR